MPLIYKLTNQVNGKSYIGFTSDLKIRIYNHKSSGNSDKAEMRIHKAIKKYGFDKFDVEVLYESKDEDFVFTIMEPYFIKKYGTYEKYGYNECPGGKGRAGPHTQSTKDKISISKKSPENIKKDYGGTRKSTSKKNRESPNSGAFKVGHIITEEHKKSFRTEEYRAKRSEISKSLGLRPPSRKGSISPNKGKKLMWITDGNITKLIPRGEIPQGFRKGRIR